MAVQELGTEYTAVVLAAGYGSRIRGLTEGPKCLLRVGEETLLDRNFRIWGSLGIRNVNLVLGYKAELVREVTKKYEKTFNISYRLNEDYTKQGNTYSLLFGLKDLHTAVLIFDADLIYEEKILRDFLTDRNGDQILVGPGTLDDIECSKALIDSNGIVRKTVDKRAITTIELEQYKFIGEAIGILKFNSKTTKDLFAASEIFLKKSENSNLNWEHLLNDFLLDQSVGSHQINEGKWVEIDTPEDFDIATNLFC